MLAFASVWISLASLVVAVSMLIYRPAFTDLNVTLVLYFGAPGALCLAGLVLYANRDFDSADHGLEAQRVQAKVAIAMAILAAAIVYTLIIRSQKLEPTMTDSAIEQTSGSSYNSDPWGRAYTQPAQPIMQITLNGQQKSFDRLSTVADLLERLELQPIRVAVEINEDLVPRKTFGEARVHEGDQIEIVTFVGGG